MQVECHPFFGQRELIDFCRERGINVTAYSPFGGQPSKTNAVRTKLIDHPLINEVARRYGKTVYQILIKFQVQREVAVIPKSSNEQRILQNANIFDFDLSPQELKDLENLDCGERYVKSEAFKNHPNYPF